MDLDGLTIDQDLPFVTHDVACEDLHQCGLACTVLPHQCMHLTGMQVEGGVGQGSRGAETLRDPHELQ